MYDDISHIVNVRDKPGFLHRMMVELADESSNISLEGDLSRCSFPSDLVISHDEIAILKRNTIWPRQDFLVLRLAKDTLNPIFKQVMAAGLKRAIIHIQIQRGSVVELGAYDNFHPECTGTSPGVGPALLRNLQIEGIVREFNAFRQAD